MLCLIAVGAYLYYQYYGLPSFTKSDEVILFIAGQGCPPCEMVVDYLDENGVAYTLYDIDASDENMKRFRRHGGNTFPLLIYGDERIVGFDPALLDIAVNQLTDADSDSTEVVMYMTPQCGWCKKARHFFEEHDIDVVEYDISASDEDKREYERLGGRGTPLIYIGNNRIDGFNEKAVKMALRQVGLM